MLIQITQSSTANVLQMRAVLSFLCSLMLIRCADAHWQRYWRVICLIKHFYTTRCSRHRYFSYPTDTLPTQFHCQNYPSYHFELVGNSPCSSLQLIIIPIDELWVKLQHRLTDVGPERMVICCPSKRSELTINKYSSVPKKGQENIEGKQSSECCSKSEFGSIWQEEFYHNVR